MKPIRFRFSASKARAAILWMLAKEQRIDLHTLLKTCYFADKDHLNRYGRPIFGATYRAMRFGPVPLEIYEMTKGEPYWLAELGEHKYPWRLDGYYLALEDNAGPNLDVLSESDIEAIEQSFEISTQMTFNARTAATHGPDWQKADLGRMHYEDMIEESDETASRVAYLRETAPHMRL